MTAPTDDEIHAAIALANAATAGPWKIAQDGDVTAPNADYALVCNDARPRDADLIAASRTLVPQLGAEVLRLRVELVEDDEMFNGAIAAGHRAIAKAVEYKDALRALINALPKCCVLGCDAKACHADGCCSTHARPLSPESQLAAPLRAARALLARAGTHE